MNTLPPEWYADNAPVDYDRRVQIEQDDERLWTTSELIFAAYLAGFVSVMVTFGAALLWARFL